jgi:Tfp pilus assembly protein PilV
MLKSEKGFMLMEIMVAVVVLSVALTAIAYSLRSGIQGTADGNNQTTAVYLAQWQLVKLRSYEGQGKYDATSNVWTQYSPAAPSPPYTDPNTGMQYSWYTEVLAPDVEVAQDSTVAKNIIPVRATVEWPAAKPTNTLQIVTYYYY